MTIAAAYLVSEGVVFGADSTTTVGQAGGVLQLLNHAQKAFEVGPTHAGRFGLATWGTAAVGAVAHRTIVARLIDRLTPSATVDQARQILIDLVQGERRIDPARDMGDFGYFFGGVDPVTRLPRCFVLRFVNGVFDVGGSCEMQVGEAHFQGAPQFFGRAFHGFDPGLPEGILRELRAELPDVADLVQKFEAAFNRAAQPFASAGFRDLPIREAIDFVHTYLHVTVKAFKFRIGPPVCGGPLEIGFITPDRPFRWVLHKPFTTALLEPATDKP